MRRCVSFFLPFSFSSTSRTDRDTNAEQKQTLYLLHSNTTPGFIHSVSVSLYDPPLLGIPMWLVMLLGALPLLAGVVLIVWGLKVAPQGDDWVQWEAPEGLDMNWGFKELSDIKFGDEL